MQAALKFSKYIEEQTLSEINANLTEGFTVDTEIAEEQVKLTLKR